MEEKLNNDIMPTLFTAPVIEFEINNRAELQKQYNSLDNEEKNGLEYYEFVFEVFVES